MSDGFAVLGPANPPVDFDFQADTFGSQTSCRPVTGLCGANSTIGARYVFPSSANFACNASVAGLNMTGNFDSVLSPLNKTTLVPSGPPVTDGSDGQKPKGVLPAQFILGENTIVGNTYPIGFQYFNDSQKLRQRETPSPYYGYEREDGNDSHLHWAVVWRADFESPIGTYVELDQDPSNVSAVGISTVLGGGSQGILSCDTSIYEIVSTTFSCAFQALS